MVRIKRSSKSVGESLTAPEIYVMLSKLPVTVNAKIKEIWMACLYMAFMAILGCLEVCRRWNPHDYIKGLISSDLWHQSWSTR